MMMRQARRSSAIQHYTVRCGFLSQRSYVAPSRQRRSSSKRPRKELTYCPIYGFKSFLICAKELTPALFWEPSIYQTRKQHEFFEEASAAGLVYGLTMPLHGARGELGALSLSVEAENRAEANRFMESVLPTLWMLKDYALQSGAGLAFEHPVSKPVVLTSREKEVLQWCAIGKTSWEISVICNCSEANVNFHMGNIRRKFGVTSRRVAAIMAVNLGLITL